MQERPNIEHVMTFLKVVELESFSQAADALALSKSVVSKHVSSLEQCLHAQLLLRSTRKLILTEEGKTFHKVVKAIPDSLAAAQNAIQPYQERPFGLLKVIAPLNFSISLKKQAVPSFLARYPDVSMQIQFVSADHNMLAENADVFIMWKLSNEIFPDYNLIAKRLLRLPTGLYATPEYLAKNGTPKTPEDLIDYNCFAITQRPWPFQTVDGKVSSVPVKGSLQTSDDIILHSAVCNHIGITYSHKYIFLDELKSGKVVPILEDYTHLFLEIYAFYQPTVFIPQKISCFLATLTDYYQSIQDEILQQ